MMADYGLGISVTPLEALRGYPHLTRRVIAEKGLVSTLELVLRKDAYISASAKALFTVLKSVTKSGGIGTTGMDGILNQQEAGFWTFYQIKKPPPWRDPWWG